jgi:asparagine synthase (glutamine-hydrolysing)
MCGIAGIWNFDGKPVEDVEISAFTDSLAHRGPDGRGIWRDDQNGIALGHRRLAILDLSEAGKQPMVDPGDRFTITFNGEIYNFIELRNELSKLGYVFRSESDTEVILAAYREWGEGMLYRFNGMWALAIWDALEHRLFLARDRFGIKPLHYLLTPSRFCFASELKAFRSLVGFVSRIDFETAEVLLHAPFRVEGSKRTLVAGVHRLQGGHCATISADGNLQIRRWWNTLEHLVPIPRALEEQSEQFYEIFSDSIKLRMRSDVPLGTCLSGGFDSTAVLCTMREITRNANQCNHQMQDWQHAFVATFPGSEIDEREQAEEVLRFTGVSGTILPITDKDATCDIEKILFDFDDVYVSIPTSTWLLYREMRRKGIVVSLDGHGADELMGGYKQADFLFLHDAPSMISSPFENIRRIAQMRRNVSPGRISRGFSSIREDMRSILRHHPSFANLKKRYKEFSSHQILIKQIGSGVDFTLPWEQDVLPDHWDEINRDLYLMFHATTLPTILRNFDRLSMAHGIEVRMPFMDYRLVNFLMSLPSESKIGGTMTKRVAREAMRGKMPESIRASRLKIGFNSPMPEWLSGPLQPWMDKTLERGKRSSTWHDLAASIPVSGRFQWHDASKQWLPLHLLAYAQQIEGA